MKTIVYYYSRTGHNRKVGERVAKELKADIEEIIDLKNRQGFFGFLSAGMDAVFKSSTKIRTIQKKPQDYDLVILGGPIWAGNIPAPIRTFMNQNPLKKKVALFCVIGGKDEERFFKPCKELIEGDVVAEFSMHMSEVDDEEKVKNFVRKLK